MSRSRSQAGKLARRKGQSFERTVARILQAHWPDAWRTVDQVRTAKVAGPDIARTPFWFELQHAARTDVDAKLAQGEADTDGRPVVVIAKANRRALVAHTRLSTLTREPTHTTPVSLTLARFLALVAPTTESPTS